MMDRSLDGLWPSDNGTKQPEATRRAKVEQTPTGEKENNMHEGTKQLYEISNKALDAAHSANELAAQLGVYRDQLAEFAAQAGDIVVEPEVEPAKRELMARWRDMLVALDAALAALGAK